MTSKADPEIQSANDSAHAEAAPAAVEDPQDVTSPLGLGAQTNHPNSERDAPDLRGHVDQADPGQIVGWLYDLEQPGRPLTVEIVLDGVSIARQIANRPQQGLVDSGIGDGRHGFAFSLDNRLLKDGPHQLIAREYWTG